MGLFTTTPAERLGADLLDRLPLGISVYRLEAPGDPRAFRLTYSNPASGRLTGLDVEAEVGRMLVDVVPNIGETGVLEGYLEVLADGEPRDLGTIEYGDDRIETATYAIRAIPLGADRLAVVFEDVSERAEVQALRDAQAELHREEARYRSLVEATAAIVWTTPPSGELGPDQDRWLAYTGQTADQAAGWGWLDAIHPDDRDETAEAWRTAIAETTPYRVEHRLRDHAGAYRRMAVRGAPVLDDGGHVVEWVGVHTDIEERRKAAVALRASEARFRTLVDAIGDVLLVYPIGPAGGEPFVAFNEAALSRYGYSADELRAMTVDDLVDGDRSDIEGTLDELRRARSGTFEGVHRAKSGERIYMSTHARLVEYDGRLCVVALCRDDAAGRQFRRAIARSNRQLEQAVAARTAQLEAFSEDLKLLHGITTAEHVSPEARFEAFLRAGCEMFELPVGILSSTPLDPETGQRLYRLEAVVAPDPALEPGLTVPISEAFCDAVVEGGGRTMAYGDARVEAPEHPACADRGFRAYLGASILVDGELFGTLSFISPEPRPDGFADSERDLIEVMSQAVGRQLSLDRAERERTQAEALHRSVLSAVADGIYGLDLNGRTTFVNPAAVALTGWSREEQMGSRQHDLIHHHRPDGAPFPAETCRIYQTLRDGQRRTAADEVFWHKDGSAIPVSYVVTPILEGGEVAGAVVTFSVREGAEPAGAS